MNRRKIFRVTAVIAALSVVIWLVLRFSPYPSLKLFLERPYSIRYYDRNGMLLQITPLEDGLRREKPREIPAQLKDVFVFAEDRRYYLHCGVDGFSIIRALFQNIKESRRISGASTITMQLARLIADNAQNLEQEKLSASVGRRQTLGSKIAEALNALRLETRLSKNEILELYLNSLPFGFNAEGAASAARNFFAVDIEMLSGALIFALAVIPRRPGYYNPLDNPENCAAAAAELQARFAKNKKLARKWPLLAQIGEDDWKYAIESARRFQYPFELPHLIRGINAYYQPVEVQKGNRASLSQHTSGSVEVQKNGAGEVRLSVDLALQRYLERTIAANVAAYYSWRLTNGAALVIDNETGEILAWAGSAGFFNDEDAGQIDGVLALNQPGSSMKPFLYAMALENGFKPTDLIADIPMTFGETEIYSPRNFNDRFNGPVLFRNALASSLNLPAVYLLYRLSVQKYSQLLFSLGFDSLKPSAEDAGLGLALGNAPVSLFELVRAFSVFPRDGVFLQLTWELGAQRVQSVAERTESGAQRGDASLVKADDVIFSADTARLICSFLSDSSARVLAFGSARNFRTGFPSIFKTGTANQYQSIVALGASPKYTVGVWMGNFTGETVMGKTGSSIPAAIARDTLTFLHETDGNYPGDFPAPEGWQMRRVCAVSGMEPVDACLSVVNEYTHPYEEINHCTWHRIVNGRIETVYPAEYQTWFTTSLRQGSLDYASRPLEIINPRNGFVYLTSSGIGLDEIPVEVIGGGEDELFVTHNDRSFNVYRPFIFYLPHTTGLNILTVKNGNEEQNVVFTVVP